MALSIDRFEAGFAICEDLDTGEARALSRENFSMDVAEGDLVFCEDGVWKTDREATAQRREMLLQKKRNLMKKKKNDPE